MVWNRAGYGGCAHGQTIESTYPAHELTNDRPDRGTDDERADGGAYIRPDDTLSNGPAYFPTGTDNFLVANELTDDR